MRISRAVITAMFTLALVGCAAADVDDVPIAAEESAIEAPPAEDDLSIRQMCNDLCDANRADGQGDFGTWLKCRDMCDNVWHPRHLVDEQPPTDDLDNGNQQGDCRNGCENVLWNDNAWCRERYVYRCGWLWNDVCNSPRYEPCLQQARDDNDECHDWCRSYPWPTERL